MQAVESSIEVVDEGLRLSCDVPLLCVLSRPFGLVVV